MIRVVPNDPHWGSPEALMYSLEFSVNVDFTFAIAQVSSLWLLVCYFLIFHYSFWSQITSTGLSKSRAKIDVVWIILNLFVALSIIWMTSNSVMCFGLHPYCSSFKVYNRVTLNRKFMFWKFFWWLWDQTAIILAVFSSK